MYINDLLGSGEIPDLFAPEDRDEIVNALRAETKSAGLVDSTENCWAMFIQKVPPDSQSHSRQADWFAASELNTL